MVFKCFFKLICDIIMKKKTIKVKIIKTQSGGAAIDYAKVPNSIAFRYYLLKKIILDAQTDITLMIDTNRCKEGKQPLLNEAWLNQKGLMFVVLPIKADKGQFFGIRLNSLSFKKDYSETGVMFGLESKDFTEELFERIQNCDIGIGLGRKMPFVKLKDYWIQRGEDILFDPQFFQNSLYDSVIYGRTRSTFNTKYIGAIADEMGL